MSKKSTQDLELVLQNIPKERLKNTLLEIQENTFQKVFNDLLVKYELDCPDVIERTKIQRNYFYQVINGTKSKPGRDKIVQIALAMGCDLDETNRLLLLSKNQKLYPKIKRDSLIIFAISKHLTVLELDELFNEMGIEILDEVVKD